MLKRANFHSSAPFVSECVDDRGVSATCSRIKDCLMFLLFHSFLLNVGPKLKGDKLVSQEG